MSNNRDQVRTDRQAVIDRAVAFMDATPRDELSHLLGRAGSKPEFQRDPGLLRDVLAAADPDGPGGLFVPYKAAQRILHAAGLYNYPH